MKAFTYIHNPLKPFKIIATIETIRQKITWGVIRHYQPVPRSSKERGHMRYTLERYDQTNITEFWMTTSTTTAEQLIHSLDLC
jgi:hypothetical protein